MLALEEQVGEPRVPGSQREIAERVSEPVEDLLGIVSIRGQLRLPLGAERLGHDVLDRQVGAIEVEVHFGAQVGLEALQDQTLLVSAAVGEVVDSGDALTDLIVIGPSIVPRQFASQCDVDRLAGGQRGDQLDEQAVEHVGRYGGQVAADDERLDRFQAGLGLLVGGAAGVNLVVEMQQQRIRRAGTPGAQEREVAQGPGGKPELPPRRRAGLTAAGIARSTHHAGPAT